MEPTLRTRQWGWRGLPDWLPEPVAFDDDTARKLLKAAQDFKRHGRRAGDAESNGRKVVGAYLGIGEHGDKDAGYTGKERGLAFLSNFRNSWTSKRGTMISRAARIHGSVHGYRQPKP